MSNKNLQDLQLRDSGSLWGVFWEIRKASYLGRLLACVRKRFINKAFIKFFLKSSHKGTLIEAGCGSADVALQISKIRGDKLVLVDISSNALNLAKKNATELNLKASFIQCDIENLSTQVKKTEDSIAFNIGVIEHFKDCTNVLQEMLKVSGRYSIAIVPENSIFWKTFIWIEFKLKLLPEDLYTYLFNQKELEGLAEKIGAKINWIKRVRVLGVFPYLAICLNFPKAETFSKKI
jgi:ubiquinone/menaquinone biosynthesis C-methylase UbiE